MNQNAEPNEEKILWLGQKEFIKYSKKFTNIPAKYLLLDFLPISLQNLSWPFQENLELKQRKKQH